MDNFLQQMKQIVGAQDIHGIQITVEEGGELIRVDIAFKTQFKDYDSSKRDRIQSHNSVTTILGIKRLEIFETSSAYRDIIQAIAKVRSGE